MIQADNIVIRSLMVVGANPLGGYSLVWEVLALEDDSRDSTRMYFERFPDGSGELVAVAGSIYLAISTLYCKERVENTGVET